MEVENLETIRYVIVIVAASGNDTEYYFSGRWGTNTGRDLARLRKDGYKVGLYNEVYYTTELACAKTYNNPKAAMRQAKELKEDTWANRSIWSTARPMPIKGQEIFKAQLKGPGRVTDKDVDEFMRFE